MSETIRTSLPERDPTSHAPAAASSDETRETPDLSHLPTEHREVMRRLQDQVERAVAIIEELRAENERLQERVQKLEKRPAVPEDKTVVALDDDPEVLRDRVTGFIEAIDAYLEGGLPAEDEKGGSSPSANTS